MIDLRAAVRRWTPPAVLDLVRERRAGIRFSGDYRDWESARRASSGYDASAVMQRVRASALRVANGEAAFERDGVLFDEVQYALPTLAGLLRVAVRRPAPLSVLDFGGGFGTSYRQLRAFCPDLPLRWSIVEQPDLVRVGAAEFATDELRFYPTLADCLRHEQPHIALFCSVLQYLPDPYAVLGEVERSGFGYVVIDRTSCSALPRDVLTVQQVPPEIYPASYPCWILSSERLRSRLRDSWQMVAEFGECSGPWRAGRFEFGLLGFILERRAC
jgi:putative methyltransferase (TIGR04325 family)